MTPERDADFELAQRERARREWQLYVEPERSEAAADQRDPVETIRRVLRLKRFEAADLRGRLPGVVRSGARVDLLPLLEALQAAGIRAQLRRRSAGD